MANSVIKPEVTTGDWIKIASYNRYRKSGRTVCIVFDGSIEINSYKEIAVNGATFHLPTDYRPSINVYFFITTSGIDAANTYLAYVKPNGAISIYTNDDSIGYAYGSVSFIV